LRFSHPVVDEGLADQPEKFKAKIVYLAPILASMLFGLLCGTLLIKPTPSSPPIYPVAPIPQTSPGGSAFNAIYFVIILAVGASVLYLLIKHRSKKMPTFLTVFALTAAFFCFHLFSSREFSFQFPIPCLS